MTNRTSWQNIQSRTLPELDPEELRRVAALYEVRELSLGDEILIEDCIKLAHYILTGQMLQ